MVFVNVEKCGRVTFLIIFLMAELTAACSTVKRNSVIADCSQRGLSDVPSNLPSQIEVIIAERFYSGTGTKCVVLCTKRAK